MKALGPANQGGAMLAKLRGQESGASRPYPVARAAGRLPMRDLRRASAIERPELMRV